MYKERKGGDHRKNPLKWLQKLEGNSGEVCIVDAMMEWLKNSMTRRVQKREKKQSAEGAWSS